MTVQPAYRIGFCCKWLDPEGNSHPDMNQRGTTVTSLLRMPEAARIAKVAALVDGNCTVLQRQLRWLSKQPPEMRLFRITSDFLPAAAHADFVDLHADPAVSDVLRRGLSWVRPFADEHGIRLCTHPGQFTTLCSEREDVVERSILDLEYHADLAMRMGYGDGWHPSGYAINIHGNVRLDPGLRRFRDVVATRLSQVARNLLTIENDEFSCGVDDLVESGIDEQVAMVLDIHHHWISSRGQYISPSDPRIEAFRRSWRGVRPLSHFSISDVDEIAPWNPDTLPDYGVLAARGLKPTAMRKHSNAMWNTASMDWAAGHLSWTDIEVEAKGKNLSSAQFLARVVASAAQAAAA